MLPELIYREEKLHDYKLLAVLGALTGLIGFYLANLVFPSNIALTTVVFAAIPLVYPLTQFFLERERDGVSHIEELKVYLSLFTGQVVAFTGLGYVYPEKFDAQLLQFTDSISGVDPTGQFFADSLFMSIFSNNITLFLMIFLVSVVIASAGAFVLTWNASVMGVFFGQLLATMPLSSEALFVCTEEAVQEAGLANPSFLCYLPHAGFEMAGFIIAGITGSLMSASVYREHFGREIWEDYILFLLLGAGFIVIGAALETGILSVLIAGLTWSTVLAYKILT